MRDNASDDVVTFWREAGEKRWFKRDDAFDTSLRQRFMAAHEAAARREHDDWAGTAEGTLALLLLLDQFPRNAFRGSAHMYATDPLARLFTRRMLADGFDAAIEPGLRPFCYMPLMHSETAADQDESLRLFRALGANVVYAEQHRDIVLRFGRFPHRNPVLGRDTTADEAAFLNSGGFAG